MKITKFGQSCILIQTKEKRILIDPGNLLFDDKLLKTEWVDIDILLVTHKHGDHCLDEAIKEITKNPKTKFYTSQEVLDGHPTLSPIIIKEGQILNFEDIKIEVVKAVHGYLPHLKGGNEIKENLGYIVDDGENRAYHTSDSISFNNEYKCDIIFIPVCNHGLVMGPFEASRFAKETGAKLVIPIHYDNPLYPVNLAEVENNFNKESLNCKILGVGESIKV
ncbi:MAG: MBL fold metallo-hydrolase [Candidatus Pacebacteria bacterium]|nr:MBL fold metallo-hydrolase [Candidatus Paceibacterota bacterium]MCF7862424.1 MBL fold metallo-hydrolase [Candidatus Paceibacterota bacterium]